MISLVVLDQHAVLEHGDVGGLDEVLVLVELRGLEDDVVALPLARLAAAVDQRRILAVDRPGLAVGVRDVVIRVQHLHLVAAHDDHAAVAAALAVAGRRRSARPTRCEAERRRTTASCKMLPDPALGHHVAVLDRPGRRARPRPCACIAQLERSLPSNSTTASDGALPGVVLRAARARRDDRRIRPAGVVHVPLAVRLHRGVLKAFMLRLGACSAAKTVHATPTDIIKHTPTTTLATTLRFDIFMLLWFGFLPRRNKCAQSRHFLSLNTARDPAGRES